MAIKQTTGRRMKRHDEIAHENGVNEYEQQFRQRQDDDDP